MSINHSNRLTDTVSAMQSAADSAWSVYVNKVQAGAGDIVTSYYHSHWWTLLEAIKAVNLVIEIDQDLE